LGNSWRSLKNTPLENKVISSFVEFSQTITASFRKEEIAIEYSKCSKRETSWVMFDALTIVSDIIFDIFNFGLHLLLVTLRHVRCATCIINIFFDISWIKNFINNCKIFFEQRYLKLDVLTKIYSLDKKYEKKYQSHII